MMHVHLVFVTSFRHKVLTDVHLRRMEEIARGGRPAAHRRDREDANG
ncbi:hypothetical protein [Streptomyces canus]